MTVAIVCLRIFYYYFSFVFFLLFGCWCPHSFLQYIICSSVPTGIEMQIKIKKIKQTNKKRERDKRDNLYIMFFFCFLLPFSTNFIIIIISYLFVCICCLSVCLSVSIRREIKYNKRIFYLSKNHRK